MLIRRTYRIGGSTTQAVRRVCVGQRAVLAVVLVVVAALWCAACSTPVATGDAALLCTAGQSVTCPCPGGISGALSCRDDGRGYGACVCGSDAGGLDASDITLVNDATGDTAIALDSRDAAPNDATDNFDAAESGGCFNPAPATCTAATGPCGQWFRTEPNCEFICIAAAGHRVSVCTTPPPGATTCMTSDGYTCGHWALDEATGQYDCFALAGYAISTCANPDHASLTCQTSDGLTCIRWTRVDPTGEWMCVALGGHPDPVCR